MAKVNDQIQDAIIKRQIDVLRLSKDEANKATQTINKSNDDLIAAIVLALTDITGTATQTNLDRWSRLQRKIARIRAEAFRKAELDLDHSIDQLTEDDSEWSAALLLLLLGASVPVLSKTLRSRLSELTAFSGRTSNQWWTTAYDADVKRIMTMTRFGKTNGLTDAEILQTITGTQTATQTGLDQLGAGALKTTVNDVSTITRTITTGSATQTRTTTFAKAEQIDRVQWVSILDAKTSQICRGLSGEIWEIDVPHPYPPAHPSCRSILTYLKAGQSAAEDLSYDEWLRRQSVSYQKDILPRWQYREFAQGRPLKSFLMNDLSPMTMAEFIAQNKK